ncbi:MAG TPA: hypothetical protein VH063_10595 [Gaiellaceae bacterium]|nr:hypothetical protein [Gaiellaceae bacterium]
MNTRPERWLWFMDTEGRTVMRVWAEHYRFRDLEHLKALLGVPWNYETAYSRMLDFERAHPRSVPWPLAHYWLSSLAAITASLVVLGFVLVLVQQG